MRIGIVAPFNPTVIKDYLYDKDTPSINNTATAVNTIVYEFLEQGHQVIVFTLSPLQSSKVRILRGENISVYLMPSGFIPGIFGVRQFGLGQFYQPRRIAKVIKKEISNIDVLHAHWTYEYAKAASLLSKSIPVFDTVRDWCPYQLTLMRGKQKLDWKLKEITFKQVMADNRITFIANSAYTYKMITDAYPEKKVPIIPNPIDKKWILEKKEQNCEHKIITIASDLSDSRKNIGKLLEAFTEYRQTYPDASLHIVGYYNENGEEYKTWVKRSLLKNVHFYGSVTHDDLRTLLDKMSMLVHPSVEETFGNILLEAMSRCIPCIGGDKSGAVPDVLGQGKYGLLCDVSDSHSIAKAMMEMNDNCIRETIVKNATQMLISTYASNMIANRHIELFRSVLK